MYNLDYFKVQFLRRNCKNVINYLYSNDIGVSFYGNTYGTFWCSIPNICNTLHSEEYSDEKTPVKLSKTAPFFQASSMVGNKVSIIYWSNMDNQKL